MSFRFRRNLSCFYCGSRFAEQWNGAPCSFVCKQCEATNYLDKNGNITDPPASSTPDARPAVRYAHATKSPPQSFSSTFGAGASSSFSAQSDSPFCATCLQNQHFAREILANYVPDEDSPEYKDHMDNFEKHKKEVLGRYPQCCASCAPRIRQRILDTSRMTKAEHIKNVMGRTRAFPGGWQKSYTLTDLVVSLAGLVWWMCLIVPLLWHMRAALLGYQIMQGLETEKNTTVTITGCVRLATGERHVPAQCLPDTEAWIPETLVLGLLVAWWNPQMRQKLQSPGSRYRGTRTYYLLQIAALGYRWLIYTKLGVVRQPGTPPHPLMGPAFHAFQIAAQLLVTFISYKALKLQRRQAPSLHLNERDILPDIPKAEGPPSHFTRSHGRQQQQSGASPFPISNLALSRPSQAIPYTNQPRTPPPEDHMNPSDLMDWTPTNRSTHLTSFSPLSHPGASQDQPMVPQGPSPFHGTLPAAPTAPAHRLRNPDAYDRTRFRRATSPQRDSVFGAQRTTTAYSTNLPVKSGRGRPPKNKSSTLFGSRDREEDEGFESDTTVATTVADDASVADFPTPGVQTGGRRRDINMQQPRFWPKRDTEETGLEDLFAGRSFGFDDSANVNQDGQVGKSEKKGGWGLW